MKTHIKRVSVLLFPVSACFALVIGLSFFSVSNDSPAHASAQSWDQSNWSGGETATDAFASLNSTGWTRYQLAGSDVLASDDVRLSNLLPGFDCASATTHSAPWVVSGGTLNGDHCVEGAVQLTGDIEVTDSLRIQADSITITGSLDGSGQISTNSNDPTGAGTTREGTGRGGGGAGHGASGEDGSGVNGDTITTTSGEGLSYGTEFGSDTNDGSRGAAGQDGGSGKDGGGGGLGGAAVSLYADTIILSTSASITSDGADGFDGDNATGCSSCKGAGGGGGGSGGSILLSAHSITFAGSNTLSSQGGDGGDGGNSSSYTSTTSSQDYVCGSNYVPVTTCEMTDNYMCNDYPTDCWWGNPTMRCTTRWENQTTCGWVTTTQTVTNNVTGGYDGGSGAGGRIKVFYTDVLDGSPEYVVDGGTVAEAGTNAQVNSTKIQALFSTEFDSENTESKLNTFSWTQTTPGNSSVELQLRTSPDGESWTGWMGPDGTLDTYFSDGTCSFNAPTALCTQSDLPNDLSDGFGDRWVQYQVLLTADQDETPIFDDFNITFDSNSAPIIQSVSPAASQPVHPPFPTDYTVTAFDSDGDDIETFRVIQPLNGSIFYDVSGGGTYVECSSYPCDIAPSSNSITIRYVPEFDVEAAFGGIWTGDVFTISAFDGLLWSTAQTLVATLANIIPDPVVPTQSLVVPPGGSIPVSIAGTNDPETGAGLLNMDPMRYVIDLGAGLDYGSISDSALEPAPEPGFLWGDFEDDLSGHPGSTVTYDAGIDSGVDQFYYYVSDPWGDSSFTNVSVTVSDEDPIIASHVASIPSVPSSFCTAAIEGTNAQFAYEFTYIDPDGITGDSMSAEFEMTTWDNLTFDSGYSAVSSTPLSASYPGTLNKSILFNQSVDPTNATINFGKTYRWRVRVTDADGNTSPWYPNIPSYYDEANPPTTIPFDIITTPDHPYPKADFTWTPNPVRVQGSDPLDITFIPDVVSHYSADTTLDMIWESLGEALDGTNPKVLTLTDSTSSADQQFARELTAGEVMQISLTIQDHSPQQLQCATIKEVGTSPSFPTFQESGGR